MLKIWGFRSLRKNISLTNYRLTINIPSTLAILLLMGITPRIVPAAGGFEETHARFGDVSGRVSTVAEGI